MSERKLLVDTSVVVDLLGGEPTVAAVLKEYTCLVPADCKISKLARILAARQWLATELPRRVERRRGDAPHAAPAQT